MTAEQRGSWRRWGIFNLVGILGFAIQLGVLFVLKHFLGLDLLLATVIAVEIAVLHNFLWHEHVTWADVVSPRRLGMLARLLRFHLANGLISIAGNAMITWFLVKSVRLPYMLANVVAVLICSLLNFLSSDRFVFRRESKRPRSSWRLRLFDSNSSAF